MGEAISESEKTLKRLQREKLGRIESITDMEEVEEIREKLHGSGRDISADKSNYSSAFLAQKAAADLASMYNYFPVSNPVENMT